MGGVWGKRRAYNGNGACVVARGAEILTGGVAEYIRLVGIVNIAPRIKEGERVRGGFELTQQ